MQAGQGEWLSLWLALGICRPSKAAVPLCGHKTEPMVAASVLPFLMQSAEALPPPPTCPLLPAAIRQSPLSTPCSPADVPSQSCPGLPHLSPVELLGTPFSLVIKGQMAYTASMVAVVHNLDNYGPQIPRVISEVLLWPGVTYPEEVASDALISKTTQWPHTHSSLRPASP